MNQTQLWALSHEDFNRWRQQNDLPRLLSFFKKTLPMFSEWLQVFKITDIDFCNSPHTGEWFIGEDTLNFVEYIDNNDEKIVICQDFDEKFKFLSKHRDIKSQRSLSFVPYLQWGKNQIGKDKFILIDKLNNGYDNTIKYGLWSGGTQSHAHLLKEFPVLKLGQIALNSNIDISQRNLDFVDLDNLQITGQYYGSHTTEMNFSSCRNINLNDTSLHHINFRYSEVNNFNCIDGSMQDFLFEHCSLWNFTCTRSNINGLEIIHSRFVNPLIDRTEIQRFTYTPSKGYDRFKEESDTCRRLRTVFQSIGRRAEAEHYYYLERDYERKAEWNPYSDYRQMFPSRTYTGSLKDIFNNWRTEHISGEKAIEDLTGFFKFHFKVWTTPKYMLKAFSFKFKYFNSLIGYLTWGYGLKPIRVIGFAIFTILSFSGIYYFSELKDTSGSLLNSIYFSTVTFTTLGYGDILPAGSIKLVCALEALMGAITMGLIIGVFSNRTNY